ncbi:MHYT domain-containing protein [Streptomyces rhizosphaericola]|uniref:MHYT domain-containing protein n=1 Tax=Streptomyces rhizosphaericola TaxID=2564098 RepID=UPI0039EFCC86
MRGTVDGFTHGPVILALAFLVACLGAAVGLRCAIRPPRTARAGHPPAAHPPAAGKGRPSGTVRLLFGALSVGFGIWIMHHVAITGFTVVEAPLSRDRPHVLIGLVVVVVMAGVGLFVVGYRGATRMALITGGALTGLGIASTHYLGMAGIRFQGHFTYETPFVVLSVLIAATAATAALRAALSTRTLLSGLGAGAMMALAVTGMHYTGMAALGVQLQPGAPAVVSADPPAD